MKILQKLETANRVGKEKGWRGIIEKLNFLKRQKREERNYQKWILEHKISENDRLLINAKIVEFLRQPLISIVLPVYNVEEKWLRICIESVTKQLYENWEFCIADDCSPSPHIKKILDEYSAKDSRVKVVYRAENGHISAASNSALELANGEFCVLLDHDDELSEDALFYVAKELNDFPDAQMIYSDEDMIDERGKRYKPKFKPDFSRDLMYSLNLVTHLSAYQTDVLRKINGFRIGAEGSQDYDLALRVIEGIPEDNIRHIPRILYHWRAIRGSVALSSDEKPYAHERAREAIRGHLERTGKRAEVVETEWNFHRVRYRLPEILPKIGLIIYSEGKLEKNHAEDFRSETDYENLETIFVENSNVEKLNSAAEKCFCEILVFVDANVKPMAKDWLKELVGFVIQTEIGAVGAKILSNGKDILHGGLVVGTEQIISAAHCGFLRESEGNMFRLHLTNNFSAISIACLCVRKSLFEKVGGFDFQNLPNRFFDTDFCLKLREKKYRIVFTPYAEFMKIDDKKRLNFEQNPTVEEIKFFINKWRKIIECDPFYNPNLSKKDASFSIRIQ